MSALVSWVKKELHQLTSQKAYKVEEVVVEANLQCIECQKRLADIASTMLDAESMVIHVLEKKVTLTRKIPVQ